MQPDDYTHWIEALGAALVALGGWVWRVGRKYQQQEDRIARMEQWQDDHRREFSELAGTLVELRQGLAVQTVELRNICRSLDELRADQRGLAQQLAHPGGGHGGPH